VLKNYADKKNNSLFFIITQSGKTKPEQNQTRHYQEDNADDDTGRNHQCSRSFKSIGMASFIPPQFPYIRTYHRSK